METITEREMLLQDEFNLLAYEQRELNNYKQKEGASVKAIETKQHLITQRLNRFNRLNFIYNQLEQDLNCLATSSNQNSLKSKFTKEELIDLHEDRITQLELMIAQIEIDLIDTKQRYQAAPQGSLSEMYESIIIVVSESILRSLKYALKHKTNIYLKPNYLK